MHTWMGSGAKVGAFCCRWRQSCAVSVPRETVRTTAVCIAGGRVCALGYFVLEKILLYSPFEGTEKGILKYKAALHGVFDMGSKHY